MLKLCFAYDLNVLDADGLKPLEPKLQVASVSGLSARLKQLKFCFTSQVSLLPVSEPLSESLAALMANATQTNR